MTKETKILDSTVFMSLNQKPDYWADTILKYQYNYIRKNTVNEISNNNFNINLEAEKLEKFYREKFGDDNMILVLIIYFLIFMILSFGTKKLSNKFFLFNMFALAMIFICFALSIFPAKTVDFPSKLRSFDLFRYYWQMDLLRSGSFNEIVSFVFEKIWFGFRIIEYLLSLLTNCNSLLVVVSIIINFFVF